MMKKDSSNIVRGFIAHHKVIYIIVIALVAVGIIGLSFMNKDEFPSFQIKQGLVAGVYPGATAAEVEDQLTKPLEDVLFSFTEVNRQNTYSYSRDGICYIFVDLTVPAKKKDEAWSKIKLKLDATKMMLPPGVLAVTVLDDFSAVSSLLIAMESEDKSYTELLDYAEALSSRLQTIPEMANVSIVGAQSEEIAVDVDLEKLSSYGISPATLLLDYQTSGLQVPSGTFKTDYVNSPLHINSALASEHEVLERIIYSDPAGNIVRLGDVAEVTRRYKSPTSVVEHNGKSSLILSVEKRMDNDIVAFGREVDKVLAEFSGNLPDSVHLSRITDQPKVVETSVVSFLRDLVISMVVVILVMLLLFPIKSALIASSGVPVCTAIALAIMFIAGIDLNTVSLAALIVVLGMIVDDSIITMDGYMDKIGRGMPQVDAAAASAKELFMPMFTATLAISVMFFPVKGIITGYLGDFVTTFPWVIAIALGTSLIYAVVVVPSLEVRFIKPGKPEKAGWFSKLQGKFFDGMQKGYEKMEAICFRHPKLTILTGVAAVTAGIVMFTQLNIQMMPMAERDCFAVEIYLDGNASLDQTKEVSDSLQGILLADKRIKSVTSFVGTSSPRFHATYAPQIPGQNYAQFIVNTTSNFATQNVLKEYETKYEHYFPRALVRFKQMDYQAVSAPVEVVVKGKDYDAVSQVADSIKRFMYSMNDILKWIHSTSDDYVPMVDINLDPDESARLGVNKTMLAFSLAGAFNGQTIATLWEGDRQIPVNLYSDAVCSDMDYDVIANQIVPTTMPGVSVPLRQVADISPDWSPETFARSAGEESITIGADMQHGLSQPVAMKRIKKYVEKEIEPNLPEGVEVSYGGLSAMNSNVIPEILLSFICAVSVLFLFMLFHFKKASLALLTLVLSSLCLFGAFFGMWLFRLDFGLTSVLGLISLVGIIVRNGIIMFEYAEELRFEQGYDVKTAAELAGKRRMRPIFLTSCTTALGVLPMVISGDALWMPMGVVICFGTMLSIFLIVLIMPVSYWQIFKNAKPKAIANETK